MHVNHRRKNLVRAKHHNSLGYWMRLKRLKPFRREQSHKRRVQERQALARDALDDLPRRYPKSIYWEIW